jgi:outer membrane protein assembly factor BamB
MCSLAVVLLVCAATPSPSPAEDWPQWLGPRRDGSSTEKVAPWKEAPKAAWRQDVGEGHSGPVVAGSKVFLHTRVKGKDAEEVAAYDAGSGKPLWVKQYDRGPLHPKFITQFGVGPRSTPTYHDGRLYTLGVTGILACWDAGDGKQLWTVDTAKTFAPPKLSFGVSCSPLIEGEAVLINVGAKGASVVAFNRKTGAVLWKALDDPPSYSSPIAFGAGKQRQVVFLTEQGLVSLPPTGPGPDGPFWRVPLRDLLSESSTTPVKVGENLLASSVTFGSLGARLATDKKDDKPMATQAWRNPVLTCYFSTPVPVGSEQVYMVTGTPPPFAKAVLRCVEVKTGKELWKKEKVGTYHASLLRTADDRLLMLEDFGNLVLIEPGPREYKELARSTVCKKTWAHPALSGGRLYLRDGSELLCLPLK